MKELILDKSIWRCGEDGGEGHELGAGNTQLCNVEGFQCCLGQFSLQLNKELTIDRIKRLGTPYDLGIDLEPLNCAIEVTEGEYYYKDTRLSLEAVKINDDSQTTVEEKIKLLKELFLKHGYKITVKE